MSFIIKKICFIVILTTTVAGAIFAQTDISDEKIIPINSTNIKLIPVGTKGVLIADFKASLMENQQLTFSLQLLDTLLNVKWNNQIILSKGFSLRKTHHSGQNIYLVFSNVKSDVYEFIRIDLNHGYFEKYSFIYSNPFFIGDMVTNERTIWTSGLMLNQGIVFGLDMDQNKISVMPVGSSDIVLSVEQLKYDSEKQELSFFLKTHEYIYRRISMKGKVIQNEHLKSPMVAQLGQIESFKTQDGRLLVAGIYFKNSAEKAKGLFFYEITNEGIIQSQFLPFKEISEFSEYTKFADHSAQNNTTNVKNYKNKEIGSMIIDTFGIGPSGILLVLEGIKKTYRSKSYFQREIERNEIENTVDKNTYGRREMAVQSEGETLADRIDNYSGTEIQQYMYREAIVNQPIFEGYGYDRTLILGLNDDLSLKSFSSILVDVDDFQFTNLSNTSISNDKVKLLYSSGDRYRVCSLNPPSYEFIDFRSNSYGYNDGFLLDWYSNKYLFSRIFKDAKTSQLHISILTL